MRKISFQEDVLPHVLAVLLFLVVTVGFFNPVFFENKIISQHDIQQHIGGSRDLREFREATGEEGLWAGAMFSGMPAYLVNLEWSDGAVVALKKVLSLFLPHPVANIFLAFVSYYIMLIAFRVRPYLAMAGALAFGLSSYIIVGLAAGHNARIGAIALMPLVIAGIHLAFSGKRLLGFGVTTAGLSMQLRENHPQITYYLILVVVAYGLMQLIQAVRQKQLANFGKTVALLIPAALIAAGSFFGQFWAITEYSKYSIRGASEISTQPGATGLSREYSFEFSNAIMEPLTLLIPDYYGGSTSNYFVSNEKSATYKALMESGSNEVANQLAGYSGAYWGPQRLTAPYYAGAVMVLLFVIGLFFADKNYIGWLAPVAILGIMLSWGEHFSSLNYFLFDHLPGYNKFRSVTFAILLALFSIPLLGMLGVERLLSVKWQPAQMKKLPYVLFAVPAFCLLLALMGGLFADFLKPGEVELPAWFRRALIEDRQSLLRADAWRSFWFTFIAAGLSFAVVKQWMKPVWLFTALLVLTLIDLISVDKRYFTKDQYRRKREATFEAAAVDQAILKDKSYFRVYNLSGPMFEAQTSYFHRSIGGYHGAKLRRYQDLYDSCIVPQTEQMIRAVQAGGATLDFANAGAINMLNVKYMIYGNREGMVENVHANGAAWFVRRIVAAQSPADELKQTAQINTREEAVIDQSKFSWKEISPDTTATISLTDSKPYWMKYESESAADGLAVFSEIYYPKGWHATIDGKEAQILRADYVLRALEVPAGKHVIEFTFNPNPYRIGNKVTMASSWLMLLVLLGSLVIDFKKRGEEKSST